VGVIHQVRRGKLKVASRYIAKLVRYRVQVDRSVGAAVSCMEMRMYWYSWAVRLTLRPLYPRKITPIAHWIPDWSGSRATGRFGEDKNKSFVVVGNRLTDRSARSPTELSKPHVTMLSFFTLYSVMWRHFVVTWVLTASGSL
jgi:hypothetical protein